MAVAVLGGRSGPGGRGPRAPVRQDAADADQGRPLLRAVHPGPGGQLDAERFAKVPANYRPGKFGAAVYRLASPKPDNPVFLFESYNGGGSEFGCHGAAGNAAATAIDKFIKDNGRAADVHPERLETYRAAGSVIVVPRRSRTRRG